jgi:hypothetical protein
MPQNAKCYHLMGTLAIVLVGSSSSSVHTPSCFEEFSLESSTLPISFWHLDGVQSLQIRSVTTLKSVIGSRIYWSCPNSEKYMLMLLACWRSNTTLANLNLFDRRNLPNSESCNLGQTCNLGQAAFGHHKSLIYHGFSVPTSWYLHPHPHQMTNPPTC